MATSDTLKSLKVSESLKGINEIKEEVKRVYGLSEIFLNLVLESRFRVLNFFNWLNKCFAKNYSDEENEIDQNKQKMLKLPVDNRLLFDFLASEDTFHLNYFSWFFSKFTRDLSRSFFFFILGNTKAVTLFLLFLVVLCMHLFAFRALWLFTWWF